MNPYEVLGVDRTANDDWIKKAYRDLSKVHHPDKGGDPKQFDLITKAYNILIDPERRARYDATGETENKPDPIETAARQQFFAMCEELFFKNGSVNFTENMKAFKQQSQAHLDKQRADNERTRTRAEEARERIKKSPAENDLLGGLIQQKLDECARAEVNIDQAQKIFDRAYELWAEYEIDDSKAPVRQYMQQGMIFVGGSTTATGGF